MPNATANLIRRMLSTPDAANYCGSTASTFEKFRLTGAGPVYSKLGKRVVYSIADLDAWIASNRRRSTSDTGNNPQNVSSITR